MGGVRIWFNPACSTCRNTMEILDARGVEPAVVEYLQTPPGEDELREVVAKLGLRPRELLRTKEPIFDELGLDDPTLDDDTIIAAMVAHPILIQRPIVISGDRAIIGRPPERVLEIL